MHNIIYQVYVKNLLILNCVMGRKYEKTRNMRGMNGQFKSKNKLIHGLYNVRLWAKDSHSLGKCTIGSKTYVTPKGVTPQAMLDFRRSNFTCPYPKLNLLLRSNFITECYSFLTIWYLFGVTFILLGMVHIFALSSCWPWLQGDQWTFKHNLSISLWD